MVATATRRLAADGKSSVSDSNNHTVGKEKRGVWYNTAINFHPPFSLLACLIAGPIRIAPLSTFALC